MQKKGSTELCENEFRKIMEFLADYLKMIKLYEKIFCDSGEHLKGINIAFVKTKIDFFAEQWHLVTWEVYSIGPVVVKQKGIQNFLEFCDCYTINTGATASQWSVT